MSRLQLALNVSDLDAAVAFYSKVFRSDPAKRRPGYANFAIGDPPLKLVLIEAGQGGTLNHLGVELEAPAQVSDQAARLSQDGALGTLETGVTCCYATQDKVWTTDPDGLAWEFYTVLADSEDRDRPQPASGPECCSGLSEEGPEHRLAQG